MFRFEKIEERDIDFIIMRTVGECPDFADLFFNELGWNGAKVIEVGHSIMDNEWGETDIAVVAELGGMRKGLLIENKIDASAMPEQCQRYQKRGEIGMAKGAYGEFAVFITAPEAYLDTNAEAQKYPHKLPYEAMLSFFEQKEMGFETEAVREAIRKKERGYTVQEVPAVTQFWRELYKYVSESSHNIEMYASEGAKGGRSNWPRFRVPLRGTALYFKSKNGVVDFEFTGKLKDGDRLRSVLNPIKGEDMHWVETGNSLSLRIKVKPMDFRSSFEIYKNNGEAEQMIDAVEQLTELAVKLNDLGFVV